MAKKGLSKGLGKGLDAIFKTETLNVEEKNEGSVVEIKLSEIKKNPYQPRTIFNQEKLEELKNSIEKNGLLQPIVVKKAVKGYYIIAGERRFRAYSMLEKETIPAIIKEMSDEEMMIFAVLENLQREDLSPLEEATSYKHLMDKLKLTQETLATQLGKSRPYLANSLRLLKLPEEVKEKMEQGILSAAHGRTLLALKTNKEILKVMQLVIDKKMSVRELENYIAKLDLPKKKEQKTKNIFIEEQENKLKQYLGTVVKIKQTKNKNGKIEIEFKNNDEFERIMTLLKEQ